MNRKENQYAEHRKKIRSYEGKIARIKKKHPDFDFETAVRIMKDIKRYDTNRTHLIYHTIDAQMCKEKSAFKSCSSCNCWKQQAKREELEWKQKYK